MQKERFTISAKCNEKKYSFEIMKRTKLVNDLSFDIPIQYTVVSILTGLRGVDAMYQYNTVLHNTVPYVVHNWLTVHDVVIMNMEPIF